MDKLQMEKNNRPVAIWLLIGVGMIVVQILLGGITRLTESGLSITEWKPVTGTLPPLNEAAWMAEFEKYKLTDQFKYVHRHFSLSDFKFIFFWEWFHRVWARLMGLVFIFGFVYFLVRKKFSRDMIQPMIILFILGGIQGGIGWFMVKSGLVPEKYFVGHVELTVHFIAALGLLCYTLWFALGLLVKTEQQVVNKGLKQFLALIGFVLVMQLIYGGFMAGLRAAISAPTWPDINGSLVPSGMGEQSPFVANLLSNPITVHFIHRSLAYLLFFLILAWWYQSRRIPGSRFFTWLRTAFLGLVLLQVVLGILTVFNATHADRLVILGVSHQFTAMALVMVWLGLLFVFRKNPVR
ncbi:MAG: COX15/CtaA family protein [Chitinophagaceae bacterium]|nr:COX15/CtaA family protein [Chitinophagaceae bacterium]